MSRVSNQDQLARHADADGLRLKTGGDAIALSWRAPAPFRFHGIAAKLASDTSPSHLSDGTPGGHQDQRQGRRRHHHRDSPRRGHLRRGAPLRHDGEQVEVDWSGEMPRISRR